MAAQNTTKQESSHQGGVSDNQQSLVDELRKEVRKLSNPHEVVKARNGFISSLFPCGCSLIPSKDTKDPLAPTREEDYQVDTQSFDDSEYLLNKVTSWMSALSRRKYEADFDDTASDPGEFHEDINNEKKVKFEDFPISSLRQVTRYTQEESRSLFFTEDELKQIEIDRSTPSDDVEVMVSPPPSPTAPPTSSILRSPNCVTTTVDDVTIITKSPYTFKKR